MIAQMLSRVKKERKAQIEKITREVFPSLKPYRFRLGKAYFFAKIFVPYLTTAYGQPDKSLISCGFTRLDLFTSTCFCLSWCVAASVILGANGFWLRSIPFQKDGFDDVRAEYSQMLRQQLAKGNNGLTKTKFITFGVEGESMAQVKPRLDHIQNDLLNNFHRLGVQAKPLNGAQRLKLMHDMFNMDGASKFHFDWKDLVKSGLSVKDAIAPTAFAFKNSRTFQMGGIFCAASFLSITASDISDQLLKDFLDMDSSQIVTMHIARS